MVIRAKKKSFGERAFDTANTVFMLFLCAVMIYPVLYVISRSVMPDLERAVRPFALIPRTITWEGYRFILSRNSILLNGFKITLFRAAVGTTLSLVVESMFAYAISKKDYPFKLFLTVMISFTLWFDGGLIPQFLLRKSLGFMDSLWVLVIPGIMQVWNVLILRNFFAQIPDTLEESAKIDGANELTILYKIVLPLSKPVLATIDLFHIVGHWNDWFTGVVYIRDKFKLPAMVILRQIIALANAMQIVTEATGSDYTPPTFAVQMAMTVIVAFPIMAAYPFFQKYFIKGMLMGSIKG